MSQDRHIVYAVTIAGKSRVKHRVSDPLDYGAANDTWHAFDDPRFLRGQRTYVNGQRVAFHAIRSATDPDWPANGPKRNPVIV